MRRAIAGRIVGGHPHQFRQEFHLVGESRIDETGELGGLDHREWDCRSPRACATSVGIGGRAALGTLDSVSSEYPRDLIGYGASPPNPRWPQDARIAVQFVLNYEEGGEANILHGDRHAESYLHEVVGSAALANARNLQVESVYEYGSRAGVWRILRLAQEFGIPLTIFAVAMALERHPALARELVGLGHEIASHGWRWIDYHEVPEAGRARRHAAGHRGADARHRFAPLGLVHRPVESQYQKAGGRRGWLSV